MQTSSYIPVPKDLSKIKTKVALGLSKRQLICFGIGAALGVPLYFATQGSLGSSGAMTLMMLVMAPFFFFALYQRGGKTAEILLENYLRAHVARDGVRPMKRTPSADTPSQDSLRVSRFVRIIRRLLREQAPPKTAQETLPFDKLYRDGIIKQGNSYSKTLSFSDINYHHASKEAQEAIFGGYCEFLNYFDSSVSFQITIVSTRTNIHDYDNLIPHPKTKDAFRILRHEYTVMLKNQQRKGNNGLQRHKYLTITITAENYKKAKPLLERIEADVAGNFKALGVRTDALDANERIQMLYRCMRPDGRERYDSNASETKAPKDIIAPKGGFDFSGKKSFRMGRTYGVASIMNIEASELCEETLAKLVSDDTPIIVSLHIRSVEQAKAIKKVKRTLTDLERMSIDIEQKAFQSGHMPALPPALKNSNAEAEKLLKSMLERNERMFLVTIVVINTGENEEKLSNAQFATKGFLQGQSLSIEPLEWEQEQGLFTALPFGKNLLKEKRELTTSSTAAFVPFTAPELFMPGGLYYGLNALSKNLVMADRTKLKNPNGLFLGTPGSGKSFAAKREIVNVLLATDHDIIISDPEGEYKSLVENFHGQVIMLSPSGTSYINPMDIHEGYAEGDDPVKLKSDFVLSLCELILGGRDGLTPLEISILDRCVHIVYKRYFDDPSPERMPRLQDLYDTLCSAGESNPIAADLAAALEIYVTGSRNFFNHHTNVDLGNRLVCFDIKEIGEGLKTLGMLILQDQVWGRVSKNRSKKKKTWFYIDEMHLLLKEKQTAAYTVEIWKRFRKWGGVPTGLTQNVTDLLKSTEIENIFGNSDFVLMLNQTSEDRKILSKKLGISPRHLTYVEQSTEGAGLLLYGGAIIPFDDRFPKHTSLYRMLTTKPEER